MLNQTQNQIESYAETIGNIEVDPNSESVTISSCSYSLP